MMSMLGPLTCSALTVMEPEFPPDDLVCSLTMRLMPPGKEMARFGLETRMDWPAATKPTISALPVTDAWPPLQVAVEFDFTTSAATRPPSQSQSSVANLLFSASAEAKPRTLTLATDVLRFPPLAGSGPVSDRASEIPRAFAFKATASPLNVMVACEKLATGLNARMAVRQAAIIEFFLVFICTPSFFRIKVQVVEACAAVRASSQPGG